MVVNRLVRPVFLAISVGVTLGSCGPDSERAPSGSHLSYVGVFDEVTGNEAIAWWLSWGSEEFDLAGAEEEGVEAIRWAVWSDGRCVAPSGRVFQLNDVPELCGRVDAMYAGIPREGGTLASCGGFWDRIGFQTNSSEFPALLLGDSDLVQELGRLSADLRVSELEIFELMQSSGIPGRVSDSSYVAVRDWVRSIRFFVSLGARGEPSAAEPRLAPVVRWVRF